MSCAKCGLPMTELGHGLFDCQRCQEEEADPRFREDYDVFESGEKPPEEPMGAAESLAREEIKTGMQTLAAAVELAESLGLTITVLR